MCGKSLPRSDQRRVLGGESSSLSSANATEFLKFVGTSIVESAHGLYTVKIFGLFQPVKGCLSCTHVQRSNNNSINITFQTNKQFVQQNVRN